MHFIVDCVNKNTLNFYIFENVNIFGIKENMCRNKLVPYVPLSKNVLP